MRANWPLLPTIVWLKGFYAGGQQWLNGFTPWVLILVVDTVLRVVLERFRGGHLSAVLLVQ